MDSLEEENQETQIEQASAIDELSGQMERSDSSEDKLSHSVVESDKSILDDAKLVSGGMDANLNTFTPDMMFEKLVQDYKQTRKLMGDTIVRELTSYDPDYIEKNIRIPEFQREVKNRMKENIDNLKEKKLISRDGEVTQQGVELAALSILADELDHLKPQGFMGEKINKERSVHGEITEIRPFRKGDKYRDISVRSTVKTAIRRGKSEIDISDFRSAERQSKGKINLIYSFDASGSMKGIKIKMARRAGMALAYKAIQEKDPVGLIIFGSTVKHAIRPCLDFMKIAKSILKAKAAKETDIAVTIERAVEMFPHEPGAKHLILITDALPTVGKDPKSDILEKVSMARAAGITISVIGINLDEKGEDLAHDISDLGQGKLYGVKDLENLDALVLHDYQAFKGGH